MLPLANYLFHIWGPSFDQPLQHLRHRSPHTPLHRQRAEAARAHNSEAKSHSLTDELHAYKLAQAH